MTFNATAELSGTIADVRVELAAAVAAVNDAWTGLPPHRRFDVQRDGLARELDAAFAAGDAERARAAVSAWRGWWLAAIERAANG